MYNILMASLLLCTSLLHADPLCLSNRDGKKVTSYHYVLCPCDCSKYRHSSRRRQCAQCKHFHGDPEKPFIAHDALSLTLPALDAAFATKTE
jgi:hypothetical protein